jgi:putative transposase
MSDVRRAYRSDLSDVEWAILAPPLPPPATCGRPRKWPERLIADALFHVPRSGCAWRMRPREFPPWPTVYARFRRRRVGGPERGCAGAKRLKGRKRHVLVDTTGLVLLACVHAADVPDREGARRLVAAATPNEHPRLELAWADQGYPGAFARWLAEARGWRLHVVRHPERQLWRYGLEERPAYTFRVLPRRWVVERTFAWLGRSRRLSKDYEHLPAVSEAMIYGAMSRLMPRRLSRSAA